MRHFSCKEIALVLGLASPSKSSQSVNPAITKLAELYLYDPERTLDEIRDEAKAIRSERLRKEPMPDDELYLRQLMLEGRLPRPDPDARSSGSPVQR